MLNNTYMANGFVFQIIHF